MFFARYNIDPTASVGEFDVNKLMADLERMPGNNNKKLFFNKFITINSRNATRNICGNC